MVGEAMGHGQEGGGAGGAELTGGCGGGGGGRAVARLVAGANNLASALAHIWTKFHFTSCCNVCSVVLMLLGRVL